MDMYSPPLGADPWMGMPTDDPLNLHEFSDNEQTSQGSAGATPSQPPVAQQYQEGSGNHPSSGMNPYADQMNRNPNAEWIELQRQQNQLMMALLNCHMKSALPQRNLQPFDGNPLNYMAFARAFEQIIESKTSDDSDKLYYLEQYTKGKANDIVRSCMYGANPGSSFMKAKNLLKKQFGNQNLVLDSMLNKAASWPNVKNEDPEGLQSYSLFVTELNNLAKDLHMEQEINHSQNIKMVIAKLPFKYRDKWRSSVDSIQEMRDEPLSFQDVVGFINKQARILNNPVYGNIGGSARSGETSKTKPAPQRQVLTTTKQSKKEEENCLFCKGERHALADCQALGKKTHEEKLTFCRKKGLCYGCLKPSHLSKDCKQRLECSKCKRRHPTLLHKEILSGKEKKEEPASSRKEEKEVAVQENLSEEKDGAEDVTVKRSLSNLASQCQKESPPAVVPVIARNQETGKQVQTYAIVDNGSNATFCTESLKEKLGCKGRYKNIELQTMTDQKVVRTCVLKQIEVTGLGERNYLPIQEVFTRSSIPMRKEDIPKKKDVDKWEYLKGIDFQEIEADVDILIGGNVQKAMEPLQVINSLDDGPYACKTGLGWIVFGLKSGNGNERFTSHRVQVMDDIQEQLQNLYNADFSERQTEDKEEKSIEDKRFMKIVDESIELVDGHYQIELPFQGEVNLPNNKPLAEQRLNHLKRKFQRQPDFYEKYKECMETTIQKGYAERVPERDLEGTKGRVWYLPHHGVTHPQKDKLRVVYDCSAKYQGTSLNEELVKGPDLANNLCGVLTRFREGKVALMSDIEGMFSQVLVPDEDRNLLRLLWWEGGDFLEEPKEYRMRVHVFGAISSPSCANYALRKTAEEHEDSFPKEVAKAIRRNFYVDDCLCSTSSVSEAIKLAEDLTEACRRGGFHLTKWNSNKKDVLANIPSEERAKVIKDLDFEEGKLPTDRALGMLWHTEDDAFGFKIQMKDKPPTRRGILSTVSSLFDPMGFVSPVLLPAKQLLQMLCQLGLGWDETIPQELLRRWEKWRMELPALSQFKLSRCLKSEGFEDDNLKSTSLHHFSDASERGYGTVSYLRMVNDQGDVKCSLIISKSRVAPIKKISIPRMELTAAAVAVKVDQMIKQELDMKIDETHFWTDSVSVLRYIQSETGRFKTFVANRVAIIRDGSQVNQWHHVEGSLNPADVCSRGTRVCQFLAMEDWTCGPKFLRDMECDWPGQPTAELYDVKNDPEIKRKVFASGATSTVPTASEKEPEDHVACLINHYSDWHRLKRGVAWWLRLKRLLKGKLTTGSEAGGTSDLLTVEELDQAEASIIAYVQGTAFSTEVEALKRNALMNQGGRNGGGIKRSSPIYKMDPKLDGSLLRVGGRLGKAALPAEAKHPVILPKKSHVSTLILDSIHKMSGHCGRNYMLSKFQQRYWMSGANSAIRKIVNSCIPCRKHRSKVLEQKMADLPADRLKPDEPPFTRVGIDYFGPLEVKRGRSIIKTYGVVFTCLATRAIHIEKAESLSTDSCIAALRRFIARRGAPREMRSDNGTNFVGTQRELKHEIKEWNQAQINGALLQRNIQWTFNPPGGSHHGGIWERQIRTVRQLLLSLVKEQRLDDEGLQTLLCEVESIINGRPLTKVSDDPTDLEVLTPNHLLLLRSQPSLPPTLTKETDVYARRRWRQVQYMSDIFWRRWTKEYLPQLQQRQKWNEPQRNLQKGDLVLLVDQTKPRNSWLMGRVTQTFPDTQGFVRRAEVKTKLGVYMRPISKLIFVLEGDK